MRILSLDPSVNNVGWALCNEQKPNKKKAWKYGTLKLSGSSLEMRIMDMCQQLEELVSEGGEGMPEFLVTEKPAFFSSERGQVAAHMNYTIDLAAVNYFFAGWYHYDHRHHFAITANQWKGSVAKVVTARRFFRDFPHVNPLTMSEHAIDAVMMCRFTIEHFLCYLPQGVLCSSPAKWQSLL